VRNSTAHIPTSALFTDCSDTITKNIAKQKARFSMEGCTNISLHCLLQGGVECCRNCDHYTNHYKESTDGPSEDVNFPHVFVCKLSVQVAHIHTRLNHQSRRCLSLELARETLGHSNCNLGLILEQSFSQIVRSREYSLRSAASLGSLQAPPYTLRKNGRNRLQQAKSELLSIILIRIIESRGMRWAGHV
jgi:hypothetical protein